MDYHGICVCLTVMQIFNLKIEDYEAYFWLFIIIPRTAKNLGHFYRKRNYPRLPSKLDPKFPKSLNCIKFN